MQLFRCQAQVQRYVVNDHCLAIGDTLEIGFAVGSRYLCYFLNEQFLHGIKVGSLRLSWDPLESVPEEFIAVLVVFLGHLGLFFVDEVRV